jgi:hypothetical protein
VEHCPDEEWLLDLLFLLYPGVYPGVIHAQRPKRGCYDAATITCNTTFPDDQIGFNVDQVCKRIRIVSELFPPKDDFLFRTEEHAQYLNNVEAGGEFCYQIRRAYSRCLICDESLAMEAYDVCLFYKCGGHPSKEEVMLRNGLDAEEDIEAACQELEDTRTPLLPERNDVRFPGTIELARRMVSMQHLCPGYCDGGCFDADIYPPSCDPAAFTIYMPLEPKSRHQ